jgi:sugar phosphate isomerase/epimerase
MKHESSEAGWVFLSMNNPHRAILDEVELAKTVGFDGVELSIEPTMSYLDRVAEFLNVRHFLRVGHTRDDLAWASSAQSVRLESLAEAHEILRAFSKIGLPLVSFHPHRGDPGLSRPEVIDRNIEAFSQLVTWGEELGITVAIENQPPLPRPEDIAHVLRPLPNLRLLLDVAHAVCFYGHYGPYEFIDSHADRISHLHISDNFGTHDDHLFVGQGKIPFREIFKSLKMNLCRGIPVTLEAYRVMDSADGRLASAEERIDGLRGSLSRLKEYVS